MRAFAQEGTTGNNPGNEGTTGDNPGNEGTTGDNPGPSLQGSVDNNPGNAGLVDTNPGPETINVEAALEFWQLLAIATIPALITAAVAIGIPLVLDRTRRAAEERKRKAEKLEEVVQAIYEHDIWFSQKREEVVFDSGKAVGISPFVKVQAIIEVYFPTTVAALLEYKSSVNRLEKWMLKARQRRIAGQTQQINEGFDEVYRPFIDAQSALIKAVKDANNPT